jgi:hypothetical protein
VSSWQVFHATVYAGRSEVAPEATGVVPQRTSFLPRIIKEQMFYVNS